MEVRDHLERASDSPRTAAVTLFSLNLNPLPSLLAGVNRRRWSPPNCIIICNAPSSFSPSFSSSFTSTIASSTSSSSPPPSSLFFPHYSRKPHESRLWRAGKRQNGFKCTRYYHIFSWYPWCLNWIFRLLISFQVVFVLRLGICYHILCVPITKVDVKCDIKTERIYLYFPSK